MLVNGERLHLFLEIGDYFLLFELVIGEIQSFCVVGADSCLMFFAELAIFLLLLIKFLIHGVDISILIDIHINQFVGFFTELFSVSFIFQVFNFLMCRYTGVSH